MPSVRLRFTLLVSLYLSQGLPYGFFTQALPVLLRQGGASLPEIGLANLLALPWMLKFLWAPYVDGRGHGGRGRRRGVILPIQLLTVGVLVALAWLPLPSVSSAAGMAPLLAAVLLCNLLAATQDIATDALAVDLLSPGERGIGNGVQVAAYRVGMVVGGGALLVVFDALGWSRSFLVMATILAVATLPIALWREPAPVAVTTPSTGVDWGALGVWWTRSDTAAWLLLVFFYKLGDAMAGSMVRPMMVDAGLGLADVGWILGTVGSGMALVGALLGGWGAGVLGRRAALIAFGLLQAASVAGYQFVAMWPSLEAFFVMAAAEHLFGGMATVALFTAMMDTCRGHRAATDYTLQACVVVAATGLGAVVSGFVAQPLGYVVHFGLSAAMCLVGVGLVALYTARGGGFTPSLDAPPSMS
ncbi:MAG: MFS transporter [Pseudomonadota bacterium]|nr:MFS transporter [Pseudomonadota bacterium]